MVEMDGGHHYCRLAITPFDDVKALLRTVVNLLDGGLASEQLCLIGLATTVADAETAATSLDGQLDRVAGLFKDVRAWPSSTDGHQIVATSGPLLEVLLKAGGAGTELTNHAGITAKHMSDIENRVRAGNIVLFVRSSDPKQQLLATRTLLGTSSHHVTTYEFSLR